MTYNPSRRTFLVGASAGLAAGIPLTWFGLRTWRELADSGWFHGRSREVVKPTLSMPGPYPGLVIEVHHPASVRDDGTISAEPVKQMMQRGMCQLTGADYPREAWKRLFEKGDVVGIKVNPVGRKPKPGEGRVANAVGSISSPEVLLEVVTELKGAGVQPRDIIVFERYADEFVDAGYDKIMNERVMDGVRWHASAAKYTATQVGIDGFDENRSQFAPELTRHVVGYDPDQFVHMGFAATEHDRKDDRRFRSHLSVIVSRMVNKIVTIPVLKDHRSAGVTLALKNMSHGMNNNVARSHLAGIFHGLSKNTEQSLSGPNQCNTFIPTAVGQLPLREKATLHILDGLIGVYEGGPGSWNKSWATWPCRSLFFATDPVALDHVGWDRINHQRAQSGWPAVERMGLLQEHPSHIVGRESEVFDRRQPEHIILAGTIGLGTFDRQGIDHRLVEL